MYTHIAARMSVFLFYLHLHFSHSCVCVSNHVYALPSSSIFIHIYGHVHIYICVDYSVTTPYNLFAELTKRLCVPALSGVARCLHTCDPIFQSVYFSTYVCLRNLWMHIYHFHMKKWNSLCTWPLPYVPHMGGPPLHSYLSHPPKYVLTWGCLHHAR